MECATATRTGAVTKKSGKSPLAVCPHPVPPWSTPRVADSSSGQRPGGGVPRRASFGQVLRAQRLARALTQAEIADRARLSARAISDLERGVKQSPRPSTVRMLVAGLGLDAAGAGDLFLAAQPATADRVVEHKRATQGHLPIELS